MESRDLQCEICIHYLLICTKTHDELHQNRPMVFILSV